MYKRIFAYLCGDLKHKIKMKKLFVLAIATGLFVACNNSSSTTNDSTTVNADSAVLNAAPAVDSAVVAVDSAVVAADSAVAAPADSAHKH